MQEQEALELLAQGRSTAKIAERLVLLPVRRSPPSPRPRASWGFPAGLLPWTSSAHIHTTEKAATPSRRMFADGDPQEMAVPVRPLRLLIADDHVVMRRSFREDLEAAGMRCAPRLPRAPRRSAPRLPNGRALPAAGCARTPRALRTSPWPSRSRRSLPGVKVVLDHGLPR